MHSVIIGFDLPTKEAAFARADFDALFFCDFL
jgi:hypothetical protein